MKYDFFRCRCPTAADYNNVCSTLVRVYPFLSDKVNRFNIKNVSPYVSLQHTYIYIFITGRATAGIAFTQQAILRFSPAGATRFTDYHEIWHGDSVRKLGIYSQKTRNGAFPPTFSESPSSETTGRIEKIKGVQKWYVHPLSSCKVWCRSAAARRREKQKFGVFCLFVCLFVILWILIRGLFIQIAILLPLVGQF